MLNTQKFQTNFSNGRQSPPSQIEPFSTEAPIPSVSSGFSLMTNEMIETPMARMNTERVFQQYDDTNLIKTDQIEMKKEQKT